MLYVPHSGVWVHALLMPLQGCIILRGTSSGGSSGLRHFPLRFNVHQSHGQGVVQAAQIWQQRWM
jgi:hypothetical protein